jgi:hypothetical protein
MYITVWNLKESGVCSGINSVVIIFLEAYIYVSNACLFDTNKTLISGANTKEKYSHTHTNTNKGNLKERWKDEQRRE